MHYYVNELEAIASPTNDDGEGFSRQLAAVVVVVEGKYSQDWKFACTLKYLLVTYHHL